MEKYTYNGEGFHTVKEFEGWRIGFLRYSDRFSACKEMERHLETDEAFMLLEGKANLVTDEICEMERNHLYIVPKGIWHHIVVSKDALVLVVENSNTSKENTEKKIYEES